MGWTSLVFGCQNFCRESKNFMEKMQLFVSPLHFGEIGVCVWGEHCLLSVNICLFLPVSTTFWWEITWLLMINSVWTYLVIAWMYFGDIFLSILTFNFWSSYLLLHVSCQSSPTCTSLSWFWITFLAPILPGTHWQLNWLVNTFTQLIFCEYPHSSLD